jgi:hypothetical protein
MLELRDDAGAREFKSSRAALRHARGDGRFDPPPPDGNGRTMHIDQPPVAVDERLNAEGFWSRELEVCAATPWATSAVQCRAAGYSPFDETCEDLPIHWP